MITHHRSCAYADKEWRGKETDRPAGIGSFVHGENFGETAHGPGKGKRNDLHIPATLNRLMYFRGAYFLLACFRQTCSVER